jgi:hypothetical protein
MCRVGILVWGFVRELVGLLLGRPVENMLVFFIGKVVGGLMRV